MKELIKNTLILAKAIYSDAEAKDNPKINYANFLHKMLPVQKEDFSFQFVYDWSGRQYDDYRDLHRFILIVQPKDWDANKAIRLMYDIKKDLFLCQRAYLTSGVSRRFDDEDMIKQIYDVLKCIEEGGLT